MISLEFNQQLSRIAEHFDPMLVQKAHKQATKRTATKVKTAISKAARARYKIAARDITAGLKLKRDDRTESVILQYTGKRISLSRFNPREVRVSGNKSNITSRVKGQTKRRQVRRNAKHKSGVSVQILRNGGRRQVMGRRGFGAFLSDLHGLKVFMRKEKKRLPIIRVTGPSIVHMVGHQSVIESFTDKVEEAFPQEFERALDYQLGIKSR
jgi:hypothetical protein